MWAIGLASIDTKSCALLCILGPSKPPPPVRVGLWTRFWRFEGLSWRKAICLGVREAITPLARRHLPLGLDDLTTSQRHLREILSDCDVLPYELHARMGGHQNNKIRKNGRGTLVDPVCRPRFSVLPREWHNHAQSNEPKSYLNP